jgi:hypothetical protein
VTFGPGCLHAKFEATAMPSSIHAAWMSVVSVVR